MFELGMVCQVRNLSTWQAEAGRWLKVLDQLRLMNETSQKKKKKEMIFDIKCLYFRMSGIF